jgi:plasmid stability protein
VGAAATLKLSTRGIKVVTEIKVRQIPEHTVEILKTRARVRGVSLEEEIRTILQREAGSALDRFRRAADAIRSQTARSDRPELDSARIIREERDAWG